MPRGRPKGSTNKAKHEIDQIWDKLAKEHGCPLKAAFIMANNPNEKAVIRMKQQQFLINKRFADPKPKDDAKGAGVQGVLELVWDKDASNATA